MLIANRLPRFNDFARPGDRQTPPVLRSAHHEPLLPPNDARVKRSIVTSTQSTLAEHEQTTPPTTSNPVKRYTDELILAVLAAASIACWIVLHGHYGLFANRNNTHFAFEKVPGGWDSQIIRQTAGIFVLLGLIYLVAFWLIRTTPVLSNLTKVLIAAMIVGPAIVNVLLYPVGALDVFNYMTELKLTFFYDQNPYLVTFEAYRSDSFALPAFLVNVPLFYGPVWLLLSWLPAVVVGWDSFIDLLVALKIFNALLILATGLIAARFADEPRRRWTIALLILANPLVLFEGIGNVHNDVMMTAFLIAALLALKRKSVFAGPLLVLATLVKFYPLALAPLFLVRVFADRWGWRKTAISAALSLVTLAAVVAPYWNDGDMVDGLRDGIEQSQQMDHVSIFSLAQQYEQQRIADRQFDSDYWKQFASADVVPKSTHDRLRNGFTALFLVLSVGIALSTLRGRAMELAAAETLLIFLLLETNLYPWYLIPVFAVLAVTRDRLAMIYLFIATVLGMFYYPMYVYGHFSSGWERFHVHLFLACFLTLPILLFLGARPAAWLARALRNRYAPRGETHDTYSLPAS